jgi:cytochrome c oxidase subunit 2
MRPGVKSSSSQRKLSPRKLFLLLAGLAVAAAAVLLFAGSAGADAISPEAGPTKNAVDIDTLYKIVFYVGLAVIALVWGILFYSLFRFRARRRRIAPQIRGNSTLELGWTIGASLIVTAIGIITLIFLPGIRDPQRSGPAGLAQAQTENATVDQPPVPGDNALNIKVAGQQFFWRFQYPNGAVSFHDLVAPKDTTVTLDITSNDVAHSWWIPKLGPKFDGIRGYTNKSWFKVTKTGVFKGQCAEFCGPNHAFMTAKVIIVEPDQYQQWVENQKREIQQAQKQVLKERPHFEGAQG